MAIATVVMVIVTVVIAGCAADTIDTDKVGTTQIYEPIDYKNGVYYFPCTSTAFDNSLSAFIEKHPELRCVGMSGDGTFGHGYDRGYHVIFEVRT